MADIPQEQKQTVFQQLDAAAKSHNALSFAQIMHGASSDSCEQAKLGAEWVGRDKDHYTSMVQEQMYTGKEQFGILNILDWRAKPVELWGTEIQASCLDKKP